MRALVATAAALAGILLFLLASASAKTSIFARNFQILLGLNGAVAVMLLGLVAFQLRKLAREYFAHQFGSRLKLKLLGLFAIMAVVPGVVLYGVSLQFATRSIESWFDVRVDGALDSGLQLGRSSLDYLLDQLAGSARNAADDLGDAGATVSSRRLDRLRESAGADTATLIAANGQVLDRKSVV